MNKSSKPKAFTLVELAIVIIIIGLITGGVVGAQSLIRSANINSAIRDIERMNTAIKAFELEYDATPGMMEDAFDYWGGEYCTRNDSTNNGGCNGDGNSCLDDSSGNCVVSTILRGDVRRFFVHLVASQIYEELPYIDETTLNGEITISTDAHCEESLPRHPWSGYYWVSSETPNKLFMYFFNPIRLYTYGPGYCRGAGWDHSYNRIPARDVKQIDKKIDDGNGRTGLLHAIYHPAENSYSNSDCIDSEGLYNLSSDENYCGFRVELK